MSLLMCTEGEAELGKVPQARVTKRPQVQTGSYMQKDRKDTEGTREKQEVMNSTQDVRWE